MLKKTISLILILSLMAAMFVGCGGKEDSVAQNNGSDVAKKTDADAGKQAGTEEDDPYAEHLTFEIFTIDGSEDMMNYPLVKEACEKFNFDFTIQLVAWDNWDDVTRTLAATDSFPEVIAWYNLSYTEYVEWAREGVFKAFPSDMSAYPNLNELMEKYSIFDKVLVDGELYAFPKIKNNNPFNEYESYMFAYRRDWARQMGLDYAPVQDMTWDEFIEYLELVKAKDPGQLGDKLIPFDLEHGGNSWCGLAKKWNPEIAGYKLEDGKYVWGAPDVSSMDAILEIKNMYDKGLLAADSYTDANNAGRERFLAGRSAVYYGNLGPSVLQDTAKQLCANIGGFTEEDLGLFTVRMDDGKYHVGQMDEWWGAFAFSHDCRDEVMDRWLAVGDWLLEQEQIEKYAYGVPEEDWTKAEDGTITLNYTAEDAASGGSKDYITNQKPFQKLFILEGMDLFLEGNPSTSQYIIDELFRTNMEKWASAPSYTPNNYDINYFSSTEKDAFASILGGTKDNFIQAVISDDPQGMWDKFIQENEAQAAKACEEINAEFAK
ncbi:MAG: hypothetical protein HFJ00_16090 [Lachnospiraceae bacterium]|jgi:putative aldouronate transport system substrate-binding protein|nr:hypothetical protein [Lachnospiraceae bacterium]